MNKLHVMAITLGALVCMVGCGYRSDELFRSDVKTVYVEMFESREFRRDLEFMLTEAVKKRIGTDTPYRVAAKEKADTILRGEILEERQATFAPDYRTRQPRDTQMTQVVRVEWKDANTGRVLADRPLLIEGVDYLPPAGETEKFAQQRAIDRLARKIVAQMYSEW